MGDLIRAGDFTTATLRCWGVFGRASHSTLAFCFLGTGRIKCGFGGAVLVSELRGGRIWSIFFFFFEKCIHPLSGWMDGWCVLRRYLRMMTAGTRPSFYVHIITDRSNSVKTGAEVFSLSLSPV